MKQTSSIASLDAVESVYVAALHSEGLQLQELFGGVEVRRFKLRSRRLSKQLLVQVVKYMEFCLAVALHYRKKSIGMVNVHILGLLPLGYLLKLFYGAKLIYDTHELETETHGLEGKRKSLVKWVERLFIRRADHVFVVSENIADWYAQTYGIARPTVVMNAPNAYTPPKTDHFRAAFGIREDQTILLYQGLLDGGRGIELILDAFSKRVDERWVVVFMGYGEMESTIKRAAQESRRVFFFAAVPPGKVLDYTVSADVGIAFMENSCLSQYYAMPNKLFQYAMAGLPVIVSDVKEMRQMVEKYQMGAIVEGEEPTAINRAIDQLDRMSSWLAQTT